MARPGAGQSHRLGRLSRSLRETGKPSCEDFRGLVLIEPLPIGGPRLGPFLLLHFAEPGWRTVCPVVQGKLALREVQEPAQGHTAGNWPSWDSNPSRPASESHTPSL